LKKYKNKEWLHSKYINENLTRQKVAELAGVSSNTIRRYLRIHGINKDKEMVYESRRTTEIPIKSVVDICTKCGERTEIKRDYYIQRIREGYSDFYCDKECADLAHSERMTGTNNPNYMGRWHGCHDWMHTEKGIEKLRRHGLRAIERMKSDGTYEERMKRLQEGHSKFFSTEEGRRLRKENGVKSMLIQSKGNRTSIEKKMANELDIRGIVYIEQYNVDNRFIADFYLPKQNIIIECDGVYWHNLPEVKARDKRKDIYYKSQGYSLYRFWESEINESVEACVDIVLAEINEIEAVV